MVPAWLGDLSTFLTIFLRSGCHHCNFGPCWSILSRFTWRLMDIHGPSLSPLLSASGQNVNFAHKNLWGQICMRCAERVHNSEEKTPFWDQQPRVLSLCATCWTNLSKIVQHFSIVGCYEFRLMGFYPWSFLVFFICIKQTLLYFNRQIPNSPPHTPAC